MAKDRVLHPTNKARSGSIKHTGTIGPIEGPKKTQYHPYSKKEGK